MSGASMPEPGVSEIRGTSEASARRHPRGDEAILVVEIAVTSQRTDHEKAAAYAAGGVPTYWLLDVAARRLEVHAEPQPDGRYRVVHVLADEDDVALPELDATWKVRDLLPDP